MSAGRISRGLKRLASHEESQDAGDGSKRSCRAAVATGSLSSETDAMTEQVKALLSVLPSRDCSTIDEGMRGFGEGKTLRVGSLCTGSGMGEVAVHRLASRLGPFVSGTDIDVDIVFSCEYDAAKAQFLMSSEHGQSVPCFKNITDMGAEYAAVWPRVAADASEPHAIEDVDLLLSGWSCKDLSSMSTNASPEMTQYIMVMLQKFSSMSHRSWRASSSRVPLFRLSSGV